MDLDFNQNEEPKPVSGSTGSTPNSQPIPADQSVGNPVDPASPLTTPPVDSPINSEAINSTSVSPTPPDLTQNTPVPTATQPGQLTDLDKTSASSPVNPIPPSPPAPPKPDDVLTDEPKHQVIETEIQEHAKGSKILPIIIAILIILILIAAGAWYYSANYINQKNPTTIGIDPATGQMVDLDANGNPLSGIDNSASNDISGTQRATVATPDLTTTTGRDEQRKTDLTTIKSYLDSYRDQNGSYPVSADVEHVDSANSSIATALIPTYATTLPTDPASPSYFYGYKSTDGTDFQLTAVLENQADADGQKIGNSYLYVVDSSGADTSGSTAINNDFTTTGN